MFSSLFQPIKIGTLTIKNRFVMPAMGSHYVEESHAFSAQAANYYAARAKGGFALLITEYMCVSPEGLSSRTQAGIYNDSFIPALKRVTDAVHREGGVIFAQLQHSGNQSSREAAGSIAVSASSIPAFNNRLPVRALSTQEVWDMIERFAAAAVRAKQAGFDGVELHGAHGYLVAQFLSRAFNKRTDEFGGSLTNRARFACEIIKRIKEVCGSEYPVSVRISAAEDVASGNDVTDACAQAILFEQAGADLLNVSYGSTVSKTPVQPYMVEPGFNLARTQIIKKTVNIPVIGVGRLNDPALIAGAVQSGMIDLAALGRQSICDPEFPNKVAAGRLDEIFTCTGCMQRCYYSDSYESPNDGVSCMINPFSGKETQWVITKTQTPKKVMIVGGGPAGLEAAWILAQRGHSVSLFEKEQTAGGQYRLAAVPPMKQELSKTILTYRTLGEKHGVVFRFGTEITEQDIRQADADVFILATGALPLIPPIAGIEQTHIFKANDILSGDKILANQTILVVGAGLVGVETAEFLLQYDNHVDLIDMISEPAPLLGSAPRKHLLSALKAHQVQFYGKSRVSSFTEDGVIYTHNDEEKVLRGYDSIVLAFGARSYNPLEHAARQSGKEVYVIGDAEQAGDAKKAIYTAAKLALEI